jgi:hypothetical protein
MKGNMVNETQTKRRGHTFLPVDTTTIPPLYATEDVKAGDKLVVLHYFLGGSEWFISELDTDEHIAFGWCILSGDIDNAEWGYVSLHELETLNYQGHIVERDREWVPRIARECLPSKAWSWQDKQ